MLSFTQYHSPVMPNKTKNLGVSVCTVLAASHFLCGIFPEKWSRLIIMLTAATISEQINATQDFWVTNWRLLLLEKAVLIQLWPSPK